MGKSKMITAEFKYTMAKYPKTNIFYINKK